MSLDPPRKPESRSLDELLVAAQAGEARKAFVDAVYNAVQKYFRRRGEGHMWSMLTDATISLVFQGLNDFVPTHPKSFESWVFATAHRVHVSLVPLLEEVERDEFESTDRWTHDKDPITERIPRSEHAQWAEDYVERLNAKEMKLIEDSLALMPWRYGVARSFGFRAKFAKAPLRAVLGWVFAFLRARLWRPEVIRPLELRDEWTMWNMNDEPWKHRLSRRR